MNLIIHARINLKKIVSNKYIFIVLYIKKKNIARIIKKTEIERKKNHFLKVNIIFLFLYSLYTNFTYLHL